MQQEVNILEILKNIPNIEDRVFYSPIYGNVKITIDTSYLEYPIRLYEITRNYEVGRLTEYGRYLAGKDACTECMLYPSRQNRDWSTFKIPRKDLSEGETVIVARYQGSWFLRKYAGKGNCHNVNDDYKIKINWEYIIPVDKFNFDDWSFKEEDNYGTAHKE